MVEKKRERRANPERTDKRCTPFSFITETGPRWWDNSGLDRLGLAVQAVQGLWQGRFRRLVAWSKPQAYDPRERKRSEKKKKFQALFTFGGPMGPADFGHLRRVRRNTGSSLS